MDWFDDALCKGVDPNVFFPVGAGGPAFKDGRPSSTEDFEEEAASKCGPCPVKSECLEYAIDNRIPEGVWGGTTESQRRRIVKRRARIRAIA